MRESLLAAVIAEPDDDRPRLVFADWLLQQPSDEDRAHGELIQVQCALAKLPAGRERARLVRRAAQILARHHATFACATTGASRVSWENRRARFQRGFLSSWDARTGESPALLAQRTPIEELAFSIYMGDDEVDEAWRPVELAPLERLSSLALSCEIENDDDNPGLEAAPERLLRLLDDSRLGRVTRLSLSRFRLDLPQLRRLFASSLATHLRALCFEGMWIDDDAVEALVAAPGLDGLESVVIDETRVTAAGLRLFGRLGGLRRLSVRTDYASPAPREDYGRLLATLPHLTDLSINAPLASVLELDGVERLTGLTIEPWAGVGGAMRTLKDALPRLERLDLSYNKLALDEVQALANGPRLRELALRSCGIGDAAVRALCGGTALEELESLDLSGNTMSDTARARLDDRFGHGVWTDPWRK